MGIRSRHEWYVNPGNGQLECRHCGIRSGRGDYNPEEPCVWDDPAESIDMAKGKVLNLNRAKTDDVVQALRNLADSIESESMKVEAWAVVCVMADDYLGTAWESPDSMLALMGGLETLKMRMLAGDKDE